LGAIWG